MSLLPTTTSRGRPISGSVGMDLLSLEKLLKRSQDPNIDKGAQANVYSIKERRKKKKEFKKVYVANFFPLDSYRWKLGHKTGSDLNTREVVPELSVNLEIDEGVTYVKACVVTFVIDNDGFDWDIAEFEVQVRQFLMSRFYIDVDRFFSAMDREEIQDRAKSHVLKHTLHAKVSTTSSNEAVTVAPSPCPPAMNDAPGVMTTAAPFVPVIHDATNMAAPVAQASVPPVAENASTTRSNQRLENALAAFLDSQQMNNRNLAHSEQETRRMLMEQNAQLTNQMSQLTANVTMVAARQDSMQEELNSHDRRLSDVENHAAENKERLLRSEKRTNARFRLLEAELAHQKRALFARHDLNVPNDVEVDGDGTVDSTLGFDGYPLESIDGPPTVYTPEREHQKKSDQRTPGGDGGGLPDEHVGDGTVLVESTVGFDGYPPEAIDGPPTVYTPAREHQKKSDQRTTGGDGGGLPDEHVGDGTVLVESTVGFDGSPPESIDGPPTVSTIAREHQNKSSGQRTTGGDGGGKPWWRLAW